MSDHMTKQEFADVIFPLEELLMEADFWGQIHYFFSTGYLASDHSLQPPLRAFALKPLAINSFATRALVPSFGQAQ
jgi:hypothetical protein